jgi:hypothetical protein
MVQMVHREGVSHKGTKPDCTELNGPIKTARDRRSAILLGYQKDVMDVELMTHYIESETR